MEQTPDLPGLGPHGNLTARGLGTPGVVGMAQAPDLSGLGPDGNGQTEAWERQGLLAPRSRRICQGLDPTGTDSVRFGNAGGSGHGADAGSAKARTPTGTCIARGLVNVRGRGHGADAGSARARTPREPAAVRLGERQGPWAWHRRRICSGLGPYGNWQLEAW